MRFMVPTAVPVSIFCLLCFAGCPRAAEPPTIELEGGSSVGGLEITVVDPPKSVETWSRPELCLRFTANGKLTATEQDTCRKRIVHLGSKEYERRESAQQAILDQVRTPGSQVWATWLENEAAGNKDTEIVTRLRAILSEVKTLPECTKQATVCLFRRPNYPRDIGYEVERFEGEKWMRISPLRDPQAASYFKFFESGAQVLASGSALSVKVPVNIDLAPGRYRIRVCYAYKEDSDPWFGVFRGRLDSDWFEIRVTRPTTPALVKEVAGAIPDGWFVVFQGNTVAPAGWSLYEISDEDQNDASRTPQVFYLAADSCWTYTPESCLDLGKAVFLTRMPLTYVGQAKNDGEPTAQFIGRSESALWYGFSETKETEKIILKIRESWGRSGKGKE